MHGIYKKQGVVPLIGTSVTLLSALLFEIMFLHPLGSSWLAVAMLVILMFELKLSFLWIFFDSFFNVLLFELLCFVLGYVILEENLSLFRPPFFGILWFQLKLCRFFVLIIISI